MAALCTFLRLLFVFATFGRASSASLRAESQRCDVAQLAEALDSKGVNSDELVMLCKTRYSEGVCRAASRAFLADLSEEHGASSPEQWARVACGYVEVAFAQQRALLLRQNRNVGDDKSNSSVSDALHHKSIPIVHSKFDWEVASRSESQKKNTESSGSSGNSSKNSSESSGNSSKNSMKESTASLDQAVEKWKTAHRNKINLTSPEVLGRANLFKRFISNETSKAKSNNTKDQSKASQNATETAKDGAGKDAKGSSDSAGAKDTNTKSASGKDATGKDAKGSSSDAKGAGKDSKGSDAKGSDKASKKAGSKAAGTKGKDTTGSKTSQSKASDASSKAADSKGTDSKTVDSKGKGPAKKSAGNSTLLTESAATPVDELFAAAAAAVASIDSPEMATGSTKELDTLVDEVMQTSTQSSFMARRSKLAPAAGDAPKADCHPGSDPSGSGKGKGSGC